MRWPWPSLICPGSRSNRSARRARKKNALSLREKFLRLGKAHKWPLTAMARVLGLKFRSLEKWMSRVDGQDQEATRRGRPEVVPQEARWHLRECYLAHYGQWGPRVLRLWAIREGLGKWATGTIARIIADLKPEEEEKPKPNRYEITAPMVMWSEDGTGFTEKDGKKELLVVQDECARLKVNHRLVEGPATSASVVSYLREAFDKYGAPLVLKHDGAAIFHEDEVQQLLQEYQVVNLTCPAGYPPYNGKQERSMRDIKSYERALRKNKVGDTLAQRIDLVMFDLNEDRPRPMLGGRTAKEVFEQVRRPLPDQQRFKMEVETRRIELEALAGSRHEVRAARRNAVVEVLLAYGLIKFIGDVSTNYQSESGTN